MDSPDHADLPAALRSARAERRERPAHRTPGQPPTIAVVADGPDDLLVSALRGSGWQVTGLLVPDVFDGLLWAARTDGVARNYVELTELLVDPEVDAVCLASTGQSGEAVLTAALHAGLHVLLAGPGELATASVRRALDAADEGEAEHAVALATRWTPPVTTVADLLAAGSAGVVGQLTVRGWPTGPGATAELVDVVTGWCGPVVAVCASPPELPASELPGGARVRWALLTEQGTTVLVAHDGAAEPTMRLSCSHGRLELTPDRVAWAGGGTVPLRERRAFDTEPALPRLPVAEAPPPVPGGLLASAHRLALAAYTGDGGFVGASYLPPPGAATLRDLFVIARVREALRASAAEGRWVETG